MTALKFIAILTAATILFSQPSLAAQPTPKGEEEAYDPTLDPAFKVWRSLSGQGEPDSFFLVAQRYELGEKVQADPITALQYYILAAELDHKEAEAAVERLNEDLSKADRAEARERAANWSPVTDEELAQQTAAKPANTDRARMLAASDSGNLAQVTALLEKGLPVDVRDRDQWTPLMLSALQGHDKIVALLLDEGADIEAQDINGTTALMAAASSGWLSVVKRLMGAGADMDVEDNAGETALYMAEQFEHRRVASYLAKVTAPPEVIKEVQTFLIDRGYKLGRADGLWGPNTEKAVQSFQKKLGLPADGRITKKFLSRIRKETKSEEQTSKTGQENRGDTEKAS
ncbi:ankyrin repeat domain-containing protein [Pelagibius sp. Alg239-R121]|uniref:ankyrin repeat domain-containing protein n=1 Tax=Pelagibius sp. Alg239-R121 TaxID=2993448 RepID=UPI0024A77157|nr:ankyrin repeat domain-containing protein [Pelagibius sp. Alg239-R121]